MIKVSDNKRKQQRAARFDRYMSFFILPMGLVYLECCLQLTGSIMNGFGNLGGICLIAMGLGLTLESICLMISTRKARFWVRLVFLEAATVWFCVAYFTDNAYRVFMDIASIVQGAGGVVNEFGDTLVTILVAGLPLILIYHLPVILYVISSFKLNKDGRSLPALTAAAAVIGIIAVVGGSLSISSTKANKAKLTSQYVYDSSVRNFGAIVSLSLDVRYTLFGNPYSGSISVGEAEPQPLAEKGSNFKRNEMDVDFESLIAGTNDTTLKNVYTYLSSLTASTQNKYTGLFAGKNLIFISAEAFSAEVIDPVRTPVLYRLATKGINFTDYYQPAWGGSTSSGEFSNITGIIPTEKVNAVMRTIGHNMCFTMGNQLRSLGYYTAGYHDGEYDYYNRNRTHKWFGYSNWMGRGNGMEKGCSYSWPESDLEMFQYTMDMYMDQQPFNIYYMSVSGHCGYSRGGNAMSNKNWSDVKDMTCSDTLKAYYACNMELEYALEYMVDTLEKKGIADDTVIVIAADHYPYGLEDSVAWGSSNNCLEELYGYKANTNPSRDHNRLIIWSGCLEEMDPIVVDAPVYSLDIVPTLSNLFGVEYDSRFLVGRDVFSSEIPLVIWMDYSWLTDKGYYNSAKDTFTPNEGVTVSETYIETVKAMVGNKFALSKAVQAYDFYELVFPGRSPVKG